MEIQGRVRIVGATQTFGTSGFQKRELILTTEEQFPQNIVIEFLQANCILLDKLSEGMLVKVYVSLRGREWTSPSGELRYFNSVVGNRIEYLDNTSTTAPTQSMPTQQHTVTDFPKVEVNKASQEEEDDDLPF